MKISVGIMCLISPSVAIQSGLADPFRDYFGNEFDADSLGARIKQVTDGAFNPEEMSKLRHVKHTIESKEEESKEGESGEEDSSPGAYVKGRVSVVMPTLSSRQSSHATMWRHFRAQTHHNKEFVVFETYRPNEKPSMFFTNKAHVEEEPDLVYAPMLWKKDEPLHVGVMRDATLFLASGEYVVQFDDGDLYAPRYVSKVMSMFKDNAVAVTTTGWYNYNSKGSDATHAGCYTDSSKCSFAKYGTDFSYAYKRDTAIAHPFLDIPSGEDIAFMMRMKYAGKVNVWDDTTGLMVHVLDASDSSPICCSRNTTAAELNKLDAMKFETMQYAQSSDSARPL